jgi:hypothetical protein
MSVQGPVMDEQKQITLSFQEIVTAIVRAQDIHEGLWGIYVEFGIAALNLGPDSTDLKPTAIVPIVKFGIQTFPEENNLTVDAAVVNPKTVDK